MIKENGIVDYMTYNEGMKKSLLDKIFFMDKIDARVIIDYGCADGVLIHFLSTLFPELYYIGYDIDEKMLEKARERCGNNEQRFLFTSDWSKVEEHAGQGLNAIVLSSVIHEVYAYGTRADVDNMWNRVFSGKFDYIVIRDMVPSTSLDKVSNINDVANIYKKGDKAYLHEFEKVWGTIESNKNLIHFLLKYRYTDNWDREVRENYLPITREELLSSIPDAYEIEFHEHFILPFLKNIVKQDFNITIKDNTHLKLVLKRVV
jgi:SAM-dependent methyltransferase